MIHQGNGGDRGASRYAECHPAGEREVSGEVIEPGIGRGLCYRYRPVKFDHAVKFGIDTPRPKGQGRKRFVLSVSLHDSLKEKIREEKKVRHGDDAH
jgi:hypothetical protein